MPAPRQPKAPSQVIAVRVPEETIERLDALAAKLSRPGLDLSRSDAARVALESGIGALEREPNTTTPKK